MDAIYVHRGNAIDYTPDTDTPAGTVVGLGHRVGITKFDIPAGTLGALSLVGVFDFVKDTATAISRFSKVYWSPVDRKVNVTATGNIFLGIALEEADAAATSIRVRLE